MTAHAVMIPRKIAAKNIDSLNRSAICADTDFDNGNAVSLGALSATAGEGEVFVADTPVTATLGALWMVYSPEVVETVDGSLVFKGINPEIQAFVNKQGKVFDVFKPQIGDIITLTAEALTGSKDANTFVVAKNGQATLDWAAAAISGLSLKLLGTEYISKPDGGINAGRITAYRFEVVAIA